MKEDKVIVNNFQSLEKSKQDVLINKIFNYFDHAIKIGSYIVTDDGVRYEILDIEDISEGENINFMITYNDLVYDYKNKKEKLSALLNRYSTAVWNGTIEELKKEAIDFTINGVTDKDKIKSQEQGLITFDKKLFESLKMEMVLKSDYMRSKMHMAEVMLKNKMYELKQKLEPMLKEVKRLKNIIWTIELYLGIQENIQHVQSGPEADLEEPIYLMQNRLYMDEEVGDPENQGIDFNSIDKFYDWLLSYNNHFGYENYNLILPYKKSVRIMRVRESDKRYTNDPFQNSIMNIPNESTFLFIRNDKNIYCIETDLAFGDKLFPFETELIDLQKSIIEDNKNVISRNGRKMDNEYLGEIVDEKMKEASDVYKRNFIIMQGLIDRTEVFGKLFGKVNLMNGSAINKGQIKFVYDADESMFISDGQLTFIDKIKESRENIQKGTRVYYNGGGGKFYRYYSNEFREPNSPDPGIYELEEKELESYVKGDRKVLTFKYLPDDTVHYKNKYGYWESKERTKRESFIPSTYSIIDFDFFSHRDIKWLENMFYDRRVRKHYLAYMSTLIHLTKLKKEEFEQELPFAKLIQSKCGVDEDTAMDAIFWWKTKNQYKRALTVDDAKAFRMISKKLKKEKV